jgi:signal peptidase I
MPMSQSPTPSGSRIVSDEHRAHVLRAMNRSRWRMDGFWEWSKIIIFAVALFIVIRTFGVEAYKIPSGSMERTLLIGDFLLVNKALYGAEIPFTHMRLPALRSPQRGDVIVFLWPSDTRYSYVKRLIGLPGDTVEMRDGELILNGRGQKEQYVVHSHPLGEPVEEQFRWQDQYLVRTAQAHEAYHPSSNTWGPLIVPEKSYFMLGDNRDNSLDSRYWGFVADTLINGKPLIVYYSYERDATHKIPWLTDIRWSRLGARVR